MKNKVLRLGLLAVLLVAITMSVISGTLAKYVENITGSDSARVAKFEYTITGLDKDNKTISIFDTTADTGITADQTSQKLVAPGTEGSFKVVLTNKSEVAVVADYTFTEENIGKIPVVYGYDGKYYSSVITAGKSVTVHEGDEAITVDGDLDALSLAIGDATGVAYDSTKEVEITWAWAFSGDGDVQTDGTDTTLGKAGTAEVTVTVGCDITQVD